MPVAIEKSRILPFAVSTVYKAWVSSETVIPPATAMDIDPVVGGHYRLIIDTPDFKSRCEGIFSLVEPESHLIYTSRWQDQAEETEIDVSFAEHRDGTLVTLVQSGFASEKSRTNHDHGWDSYFDGFEAFLNDQ